MTELTARQSQVLRCIQSHQRARGITPSFREIAMEVGLKSTQSVFKHVGSLERKGYLRRNPRIPRALEILKLPIEEATT